MMSSETNSERQPYCTYAPDNATARINIASVRVVLIRAAPLISLHVLQQLATPDS